MGMSWAYENVAAALRRSLWTVLATLVCLCSASTRIASQSTHRHTQPIALAGGTAGEILVLENGGSLSQADPLTGQYLRELFHATPPYYSTDATAVSLAGGLIAYLAVFAQVGEAIRGWIVEIGASKQQVWTPLPWNFPVSGITADSSGQNVFVTNWATGEVYVQPTDKSQRGHYITVVHSDTHIGALAIDAMRERLIVGDDRGSIYWLPLASGKTTLLARCTGADIRAFAIGADGRHLYVADSNGSQVLSLDLGESRNPQCTRFAKLAGFQEPSGLALDGRGGLWVSDKRANALFRIAISTRLQTDVVPW